jgi:hypothetical protein
MLEMNYIFTMKDVIINKGVHNKISKLMNKKIYFTEGGHFFIGGVKIL